MDGNGAKVNARMMKGKIRIIHQVGTKNSKLLFLDLIPKPFRKSTKLLA
jgi:hypothetical protein